MKLGDRRFESVVGVLIDGDQAKVLPLLACEGLDESTRLGRTSERAHDEVEPRSVTFTHRSVRLLAA
jgi:hypothetical protein